MKVLTFNIQDGAEGREAACFSGLRDIQPDLILLQEVVDPAVVYGWAADLGMQAIVAGGMTRRRVAILSRYPILAWESHNTSPKLGRDFLVATIQYAAGQTMAVVCVHLAAQPLFLFEWMRLRTLKAVLQQTATYAAVPCLIAGDFNAVSSADAPIYDGLPWRLRAMLRVQGNCYLGWALAKMSNDGFIDCFRSLHSEPGYTIPSPVPKVRFDYIFANTYLEKCLQSCSVVHPASEAGAASDHCPVIAEFAF